MPDEKFMKTKAVVLTLLLGSALFGANVTVAQEHSDSILSRADSIQATMETREAQEVKDRESISDLKQERAETKLKAKEARRIEREANDAATESRDAYRSEKKAQKARKSADAQAKKASKARDKSDEN